MVTAAELVYCVIAIIMVATMLPTFFQCVGIILTPSKSESLHSRGAAFLWILLLLVVAGLWPLALLFALWEWRSMR